MALNHRWRRVAAAALVALGAGACASAEAVGRDLIERADPTRPETVRAAIRGAGLCVPLIPYFDLTLGSAYIGRPWPEGADPEVRRTATDLAGVLARLGPPTAIEGARGAMRFRYRYRYGDLRHSELDLCVPYYGWYRVFEWGSSDWRYDELVIEFDADDRVRLWSYREEIGR